MSISHAFSFLLILLQLLLGLLKDLHSLDNGLVQVLAQLGVAHGVKQLDQDNVDPLGNGSVGLRHLVRLGGSCQDHVSSGDGEYVGHEEELVQHCSLALQVGIHHLLLLVLLDTELRHVLDILHEERGVGIGETIWVELVFESTAVEGNLRQQVEILDVGVLVELPNLKVVQLLGQVGELSHNVFHLSFVLDSRVLENGSVRLGNLTA